MKPAITLDDSKPQDGYVIPYGYSCVTAFLALSVSFGGTVSEENPVTVTYYVDGKEFFTEIWKSEKEAKEFIYLDDIFAACSVGLHTGCVTITFQGNTVTSKTYIATVVKSGTRISTETTENYLVVCENGQEISEREVYDGYGVNITIDTQNLGAGQHALTVSYVGYDGMDSATTTVDVTVEKSGLSVVGLGDYSCVMKSNIFIEKEAANLTQ